VCKPKGKNDVVFNNLINCTYKKAGKKDVGDAEQSEPVCGVI
jgi:hypothetical protein